MERTYSGTDSTAYNKKWMEEDMLTPINARHSPAVARHGDDAAAMPSGSNTAAASISRAVLE